jgi:L-asparagine transporter-like permease
MLFSLARGGFAPAAFGRLSPQGSPRNAILTSTIGLALAAVLSVEYASSAYQWLFGIAIFGGILVWIVVLVTLLAFRRTRTRLGLQPGRVRMPLYPWLPILGIVALVLVLVDCFFVGVGVAWAAGGVWLGVLSLAYLASRTRAARLS